MRSMRRCETPSTSAHIVLATYAPPSPRFTLESPWWTLGLSGATLLRYRRVDTDRALYPAWPPGPCNVSATEILLPINHGRESAALFDYAFRYYHALPRMVVFVHDELPLDWHTNCKVALSRSLWLYRALANGTATSSSHILTLTASQDPNNPSREDPFDWFGGRRMGRRLLAQGPRERRVLEKCSAILSQHGAAAVWASNTRINGSRPAHYFDSCCTTFAMPAERIRRYPRAMYAALRDLLTHEPNDEYSGRACGEFLVYALFSDEPASADENKAGARGRRTTARGVEQAHQHAELQKAYHEAALLASRKDVAAEIASCEKHVEAEKARRSGRPPPKTRPEFPALALDASCAKRGLCRVLGPIDARATADAVRLTSVVSGLAGVLLGIGLVRACRIASHNEYWKVGM